MVNMTNCQKKRRIFINPFSIFSKDYYAFQDEEDARRRK